MDSTHTELAALASRLATAAAGHAAPESGAWLVERVAAIAGGDAGAFAPAFAGAGRRLGSAAVSAPAASSLGDARATLLASGRGADEVGRMALLLAAASKLDEGGRRALLWDAFFRGAEREKTATLRVLALLPEAARLVDIGVEACRSHVQTVFEAICCDNPLPGDHFDEPALNQMVLKALFTGVPVGRIDGLPRRAGADLVRMIDGYAAERRAAGRTVPDDIALIHQLAAAAAARSAS